MVATTNNDRPQQHPFSLTRWMGKMWNTATTPSSALSGEEERTARLALTLMVVALLLLSIGLLHSTYRQLEDAALGISQNLNYVAMPLIAGFLLIVAYALTRTHNYRYGIYVLVAAPVAGLALQSVLVGNHTLSQYQVYYMLAGTVLASLLLNLRETLILSVVHIIAINLFIWSTSSWTYTALGDELIFHAMLPALLLVSASVRGRYLKRIDTQIQELTELSEAERAARQRAERSDQVKSAFLASMSHELRTPLNAIINYTKFVANGTLGEVNDEQREVLNDSADSAEHLLNLINDVLDMSKIEAGSLTLFVEDNINLQKILNAALTTARVLAKDKPIVVDLVTTDPLPAIQGDRQRILQILLNILSNAVKFTKEGKIEITAQQAGDELRIAIRDSGPGIAPEHHADVFLPFKQTTTGLRQGGGTGLGMPISKSLAEAHGGRIELQSELGTGSTFIIYLPIRSPNAITLPLAA
jgi:signal transduction histidine kinase